MLTEWVLRRHENVFAKDVGKKSMDDSLFIRKLFVDQVSAFIGEMDL